MKREIWRDIPGYEGRYQASSLGRVRSLDRVTVRSDGREVRLKGRVLKQYFDSCGYLRFNLYKDGKRDVASVHVVVCRTFSGPRPAGKHVRHLNGRKANCRSSNLAWGTQSQNQKDRVVHGTSNRGERCGHAKLTKRKVLAIRAMYGRGGVSLSAVGRMYGVHKGTITKIVDGTRWGWLQ